MEDFFKEQIIADIVKGAKTNDWRKVQEWFWDHERKINPTTRILVDGGDSGSTGFSKVVRRSKANRKGSKR